ncbi:alpha-L-rhamnosidase [Sesbania bispinosa]|nr:alpha-L-rhamnosidase [Sesbania bispinosa]
MTRRGQENVLEETRKRWMGHGLARADTSPASPKAWTRKRAKRDNNDKKKAQPTLQNKNMDKPSTSSGPANTIPTNKEVVHSKPAPKIVMIGGTKVFDLGNGLKTAMKLKKVSDHQFTFQDSEEHDMMEDGTVI